MGDAIPAVELDLPGPVEGFQRLLSLGTILNLVELLALSDDAERRLRRPLLRAARAFNNGNEENAVNHLEVFKLRLIEAVEAGDITVEQALSFASLAQEVIDDTEIARVRAMLDALNEASDLLRTLVEPPTSVEELIDHLVEKSLLAADIGLSNPAAAVALIEAMSRDTLAVLREAEEDENEALQDLIDQAIQELANALQAAPRPLPMNAPPVPPALPTCDPCEVQIAVQLGSTQGDPGSRFFLTPGQALRMNADVLEGCGGGTFQWEITPSAGAVNYGFSTSAGNGASLTSLSGTDKFNVKVTYTDPLGNMCTDELEVQMQCG